MPGALRSVDTNVLLRYLLEDLPDQWQRATRLIDSDEPLGLTAVVLAEVAWTLAGPLYRYGRDSVAEELMNLLARENIVAIGFDKVEAQIALESCTRQTGAADLGDALVAACARSAGLREIYSFDQHFSRSGLISVVPP